MTGKRSGKRKKILRILIGILLVMALIICCLHFGEEQIQRMMKKRIYAKVIKYEDELLEIVKECPSEEWLYYKSDEDDSDSYFKKIYYKDLEDENVDRMFKTFNLQVVYNGGVYRNGSVDFHIIPTVISVLWDYHNYDYGFYYTENDEPVDMVWGTEVEETEFEHTADFGRYWYRTEKITDNWWYYEYKWLWFYPVGR